MKVFSIYLTAILTLSAAISTNPYQGCFEAESSGQCDICYKRKVVRGSKGCGPLQPSSDRCLFYHSFYGTNSTCEICKPGYLLDSRHHNGTFTEFCTINDVPGCVEGIKLYNGQTSCYAYKNNQYPYGRGRTLNDGCKSVSNPLPNCLWGSIQTDQNPRGLACYRCQPGYMVKLETKACVRQTITGCYASKNGKCKMCDSYSGYSMDPSKRCFKGPG